MIKRTAARLLLVPVLIGAGWAVGRAQSSAPTFELVVEAPRGSTTVTCVRGCELAWVERGVNPNSSPQPTFAFECSGARCSSFKVGGWVKP